MTEAPTAVHAVEAVHDRPLRNADWAPDGLGVRWMRHLWPFHRSARFTAPPELVTEAPTAVHDVRDEHATANRELCRMPAGLGVDWIRHRRPSQCSARFTSVPEALTESPTAVHADCALHATPLNNLTLAPAGFGVG